MNLLNIAPGHKTYAAAILGLLILVAVNVGGISVAGVQADPNWITDAWDFVLIVLLRKGIAQ